MDGLFSENCKMGKKVGSFYRIKIKEEKKRKYVVGQVSRSPWFGVRRPSVELAFEDWLTGSTAFLVECSIYRNMKVTQVSVF